LRRSHGWEKKSRRVILIRVIPAIRGKTIAKKSHSERSRRNWKDRGTTGAERVFSIFLWQAVALCVMASRKRRRGEEARARERL
jgi:hypothetical protein